jgi:hypothetical protein
MLAPASGIGLAISLSMHSVRSADAAAWAALGYVAVMSMFVGSLAWYRGLAAGGAGRIGQLNLVQPFLALAWSGLLLGEHISWSVPATAAIILACMAICLKLRPGPAQARRPPRNSPHVNHPDQRNSRHCYEQPSTATREVRASRTVCCCPGCERRTGAAAQPGQRLVPVHVG